MASIMDSLGQFLTPDTVGSIAGTLGVDPNVAKQGMSMAAPLLLGAAGRKAATPEGSAALTQTLGSLDPDQILGSLQKGDIGGMLGSLGSLGGSAGAASDPGTAMVNQLLGSGGPAITKFVKDTAGFDIGPFLPMAAPILGGLISKAMKSGNLDAAGVSKLITDENTAFSKANPTLAAQVGEALDLGDKLDAAVRAKRAKYSAEDWTLLLKGLFAAGAAVMAASPSGLLGTGKELSAMMATLGEATKDAAPDSLLALLRGDFGVRKEELQQVLQGEVAAAGSDVTGTATGLAKRALDTVWGGSAVAGAATGLAKRALDTVRAAGDQSDAAAYGKLLLDVATNVAGAAKEGGFLGFGGKQVSDKEQAVLDSLRAALA